MTKISVVINTLNEEKNLPRLLKSVKALASEIIVVDMKSDDNTVQVAKKAGAKVYSHERMGYVEPARNFAISKATGDWVLIMDADEELPKTLTKKLKKIINNSKINYCNIPRKNIIFGKWIQHSQWWPDYNVRFFRKGKVSWDNTIHSIPITEGNGMDLFPKEKFAIRHYHYDSIEQYIERMNRYTTIQAKNKIQDGYNFKWKDIIIRPTIEFNSRYFAGFGYRDGLHGLALANLQSFSELVLYLKIWQRNKFLKQNLNPKTIIQEIKKSQQETNYWKANMMIGNSLSIIQKIKRKYKLQ